jgi:hypothetical protein
MRISAPSAGMRVAMVVLMEEAEAKPSTTEPLSITGPQCPPTIAVPCGRTPDGRWLQGITLERGQQRGRYVADRRELGAVRFVDLALTVEGGLRTVALRIFVDVLAGGIKARVFDPHEVDDHPAVGIGIWMARCAVELAGIDANATAASIILTDDRLAAHLFERDIAFAPTEPALLVAYAEGP